MYFNPTPRHIDELKAELPPVRCIFNELEWWGRVTGRKNEFASVYPHNRTDEETGLVVSIMGPVEHFSWESVCRAVCNGTALNFDTLSFDR